jgi:hypothetical protein
MHWLLVHALVMYKNKRVMCMNGLAFIPGNQKAENVTEMESTCHALETSSYALNVHSHVYCACCNLDSQVQAAVINVTVL